MLTGTHTQLQELLKLRLYAEHIDLKRLAKISSHQAGVRQSKMQSRGIEFAGVRLYQPGDDVRTIDWRVTARKGKPHTKEFNEERDRPFMILLDQSPSMFFGSKKRLKSVLAAEVASLLAWAAASQGHRLGGLIFGDGDYALVKPKQSRNTPLRIMHQINVFNNLLKSPHSQLENAGIELGIRQIYNHIQTGSLITIISNFNGLLEKYEEINKYIWEMSRHNKIFCFLISDPLEAKLPASGQYQISDGNRKYLIEAGDKRTRERHAQAFADKEALLLKLCRQQSAHCIKLSTQEDVLQTIAPKFANASPR